MKAAVAFLVMVGPGLAVLGEGRGDSGVPSPTGLPPYSSAGDTLGAAV